MAKEKNTPTKSGNSPAESGDTFSDPKQLAAAIRKDRLARKLSWPAYAAWIGVKMSTIYKIAKGTTRLPHELTIDTIRTKWAADPLQKPTTDNEGGAGGEVVSSGQQYPERSQD